MGDGETVEIKKAELERLRWRMPDTLPAWDDLPDRLQSRLVELGEFYCPHWGNEMMAKVWEEVRECVKKS